MRWLVVFLCLLGAPAHAAPLVLEFLPGDWTVTDPLVLNINNGSEPVLIRGAGQSVTRLTMAAGWNVTYADTCRSVEIRDMTLMTDRAGGGAAIKLIGPGLPTSTCQGPRVTNVYIRGVDLEADYWDRGIWAVDVWNAIFYGINIEGKAEPTSPLSSFACFVFERTQVADLGKFDCYHMTFGVLQLGGTYGEGFSARDFNMVGVHLAFSLLQGGGYTISEGHMNASYRCIYTNGKSQLSVHDNLCYKTHISSLDFIGYEFINADFLHVHHNTIEGSTVATESGHTAGMVLGNVYFSEFAGNICENFKLTYGCIIVGTASHDNQFIGNQSRTGAGIAVQINPDAGSGNFLSGNLW